MLSLISCATSKLPSVLQIVSPLLDDKVCCRLVNGGAYYPAASGLSAVGFRFQPPRRRSVFGLNKTNRSFLLKRLGFVGDVCCDCVGSWGRRQASAILFLGAEGQFERYRVIGHFRPDVSALAAVKANETVMLHGLQRPGEVRSLAAGMLRQFLQ